MLHITNGDSTAGTLVQAGLPGEVLAWRDVLHEGPVPAGLALDALSQVRARFIAGAGWGFDYNDTLAGFQRRDATLAGYGAHDEVVLWFEHDLYDQLQLLQLLDYFATHAPGATRLSLICVDAYPGVTPFFGLGQLTTTQLGTLFPARRPVTAAQLALGQAGWQAFRAADPSTLVGLLGADTSALPFLRAALMRHLEQFPAVGSGLGRTERQALEAVAAGSTTPTAAFRADQAREPAPFMGDLPFWSYLARLSDGPQPLLALSDGGRFQLPGAFATPDDFAAQRLALTDAGRAVLAGQADQLALNGLDRWLGGTHLRTPDPIWRWDAQGQRLVQ